MPICEWKKIAQVNSRNAALNTPDLESIIAAVIPLDAPHSMSNIPLQTMQIMEMLQMAAYATREQVERISLPASSIAVIWSQNKIEEIYRDTEDKLDMGSWLQKFSPWHNENLLILLESQIFPIICRFKARNHTQSSISFQIETKIEETNIGAMVHNWLRFHPNFLLENLQELLQESIANSDIPFYITTERLQNKTTIRQIEAKTAPKISDVLKEYGLLLHTLEMKTETQDTTGQKGASQKLKESLTRKVENIVESIEDQRMRQSLWDARSCKIPTKNTRDVVPNDTLSLPTPVDTGYKPPKAPAQRGTSKNIEEEIENARRRDLKKIAMENTNEN